MKKMILSNRIYSERGVIAGGFSIENNRIGKIYHKEYLPDLSGYEVIDFGTNRIIPGLIELHIHGYLGWSAMTSDKGQIQGLSKALPTAGITAYTPTNHYFDNVFQNNANIAEVMEEKRDGARIIGIHMEGPFISHEKLGSVLTEEALPVSISLMEKYISSSKNNIVTVTMAPELEGAFELINFLVEKEINVCIGHTNASYEEAIKAIDLGAKISQKTANAMRTIHHRDVGVVGAIMLDDRIISEVNSDHAHVSKEFCEILYRMKGYEKICIVADEGVMSGMKKGIYNLPDRGVYHVGPDTLLHISDMTIDGSIFSMFYGLYNWVEKSKIPMEEAIVMASLNPAKVLGIEHIKGSISECKDADFVVIDDNYKILTTYIEGDAAYTINDGIEYANMKMYDYLVQEYE